MADNSQDKKVVEKKELEKKEAKQPVANEIQVEKRRNKVRDLVIKGFSYREISEKLGVCYNTVRNDVYKIREEMKKNTGPKGSVLIEQLRNEINEKLRLVEKTCWKLFEKREIRRYVDRELIVAAVNVLVSKVEKEKDIVKVLEHLKKFVEGVLKLRGMRVPQESRTELLKLINMTIANIAKVNKLIGPQTLNLTQINIGKVEHNLSIAKHAIEVLIKTYIPVDKRLEAVKKLKELDWKSEEE
ncbi:MAG: hypothetical protein ACFFAU_01595 [Candidatus Hodarchaeota archaeon]